MARATAMVSSMGSSWAALLSGFLLQTFFGNPIAGSYILGISFGAKLTVSIVMMVVLGAGHAVSSTQLIATAFAGAMLSMSFVLVISQKVPRASMLIVCGVMIGYICSAITDFIITFADDASIVNLHNWSRGSFNGMSWEDVRVMAVVIIIASLAVFFLSKPIGAYQLGESYAQNMGVNIRAFPVALVLLSSILSACVTAFTGTVYIDSRSISDMTDREKVSEDGPGQQYPLALTVADPAEIPVAQIAHKGQRGGHFPPGLDSPSVWSGQRQLQSSVRQSGDESARGRAPGIRHRRRRQRHFRFSRPAARF